MSSFVMTAAHVLFLVLPDCPEGGCNYHIVILPFCMMGFFYAFYSAVLWPCVAIVTEKHILGTAFGVITAV